MSIIDSEAAFERKCKELRNCDELFNGLDRLGIKDFSTLAFTLGTPPTDEQFEELGNKVYGTPTIGQLALLRKLHFEATTLMVASINEQVKSDSSDPTSLSKRLPAAEKQSRLVNQSKRLAELRIVGELPLATDFWTWQTPWWKQGCWLGWPHQNVPNETTRSKPISSLVHRSCRLSKLLWRWHKSLWRQ